MYVTFIDEDEELIFDAEVPCLPSIGDTVGICTHDSKPLTEDDQRLADLMGERMIVSRVQYEFNIYTAGGRPILQIFVVLKKEKT